MGLTEVPCSAAATAAATGWCPSRPDLMPLALPLPPLPLPLPLVGVLMCLTRCCC